ncbi:LytR/AlgR family response regulator transcription factor [Eudoraea adriatica]|uniref:LytR/AlgR family response regulator transcription factor n=1 Tax=Eudoraea adriatica TaxID=446681 RepID=UPI0003649E05|nr:LytTR family DNA-binding domain-containing protein [Eudoraea adriatica]
MEYSYTIIDSDATSNLQLQHYLEDYGDFVCSGEARNCSDGLNAILKYTPDVVFINLNDKAFEYFQMVTELYQYVKNIPILIGISRSKEYAYNAIKNNFFDYWLMPYNEFDIRKTLLRLKKQLPKEDVSHTLCLKSYNDYQYLDTDEILYLKADNNATDFIMKDGNIVSAYKTLKSFENRLPANFIRIHQSYILNTNFVSGINYGKSLCFLKVSKTKLPFTKTYKENIEGLKKILSKNTISPSK